MTVSADEETAGSCSLVRVSPEAEWARDGGQLESLIRQRTYELEREVQERQRAIEQLQRMAEELQRSNHDLEQYAYVASHDLQEPLRQVTSFAQLLSRKYAGRLDGEAREYLDFIVDGAARMQNLIRDLLAYSRVTSEEEDIKRVNVQDVLDRALRNVRVMLEENNVWVTHDPMPIVPADPLRLMQVFQNLIGNAVKFRSECRPRIHVGARREDREWLFSVADNGIGFSPEHSERIFQIFQRLHSRDKYTGTGIGLAICKRVIERHGGRIWAESSPGQGATFYFTIPE